MKLLKHDIEELVESIEKGEGYFLAISKPQGMDIEGHNFSPRDLAYLQAHIQMMVNMRLADHMKSSKVQEF